MIKRRMKKIKRKIDRDFIKVAAIAILITVLGINYAHHVRGYWAIGGEILIVPLIFLIRYLFIEFKDLSKEIKNEYTR